LLSGEILGELALLGEIGGLGQVLRLGREQLRRTQRGSLADYGVVAVSYAEGDWLPDRAITTKFII
jgi:hypothetical protein